MGEHDTLFKRTFMVAEHTRGELRSMLPRGLVAALDLSKLELVPGSFVDPELGERHTDLLFRAPRAGSERRVYLYFLLEHQSTPDPLMPWRVLEYQQRIWAKVLREEPGRTTLPPIVTLVVHHGAERWSAPRRLHELIEGIEELPELTPLVPNFELLIDDLPSQGDEALMNRPLGTLPRVVLWLLRDGRDAWRFCEHLPRWSRVLEELVQEGLPEDVEVVMRYTIRMGDEAFYEKVRSCLAEVAPSVEDHLATAAEQFFQKGREQGMQKGLQKGVRDTLLRFLRARFGSLSPEIEQQVENTPLSELDGAIERVLTASRPEDIFGS